MRGVVEMRFKVGDKVRIVKDLTLEDVGQVHDMLEFRGLEATVETVFDQSYHLTVDNHEWYWMDELLEPVEEEAKMEDKKYIKFDIPEWVNWLTRDKNGALYGYRNKPVKCSGMWGVGSDNDDFEEVVVSFITEDPNHYPQVKWSDEEPSRYMDRITIWTHDTAYVDTPQLGGKPMKKYERHSEITKQLNEIYIAKNTDYGDAFGDTFKKLGIISAVTRIADKTNRLMSLSAKTEAERNVKDETIKDTLMDLANYALMTLIEMEELE